MDAKNQHHNYSDITAETSWGISAHRSHLFFEKIHLTGEVSTPLSTRCARALFHAKHWDARCGLETLLSTQGLFVEVDLNTREGEKEAYDWPPNRSPIGRLTGDKDMGVHRGKNGTSPLEIGTKTQNLLKNMKSTHSLRARFTVLVSCSDELAVNSCPLLRL